MQRISFFAKGTKKEVGGVTSLKMVVHCSVVTNWTCLNLYTSNSLTPPELLQLNIIKKKKTLPGYLQGLQFTLLLIDLEEEKKVGKSYN